MNEEEPKTFYCSENLKDFKGPTPGSGPKVIFWFSFTGETALLHSRNGIQIPSPASSHL